MFFLFAANTASNSDSSPRNLLVIFFEGVAETISRRVAFAIHRNESIWVIWIKSRKNPPSIKTAGYGYLFNLLEAHLYTYGSGEIALKLTSSKSRIAGYISNVNVGLNILKTVIG